MSARLEYRRHSSEAVGNVRNLLDNNLSHKKSESSFTEIVESKRQKIIERHHLPHATVEYQLELLEQLAQFGFGRFLIERAGLDGFWTHYVVNHPSTGRLSGVNHEGKPFTSLEDFMLNRAPTVLATQQRFVIFKNEIQKAVQEGVSFASVPSGLMGDLLDLDYSKVSNFSLVGIDIDLESTEKAGQLAKEKKLFDHCAFMSKDAWDLNMEEKFDLITSNGLNIYEPNDERIVSLYQQFYMALKPQGRLVTSILTPPPGMSTPSEWDLTQVNLKDAQLQKLLFAEILECKFQVYRSVEKSIDQLKKAGFEKIEVKYDEAHIFPTLVAFKS